MFCVRIASEPSHKTGVAHKTFYVLGQLAHKTYHFYVLEIRAHKTWAGGKRGGNVENGKKSCYHHTYISSRFCLLWTCRADQWDVAQRWSRNGQAVSYATIPFPCMHACIEEMKWIVSCCACLPRVSRTACSRVCNLIITFAPLNRAVWMEKSRRGCTHSYAAQCSSSANFTGAKDRSRTRRPAAKAKTASYSAIQKRGLQVDGMVSSVIVQ